MNDIADEAGVVRQTLYLSFSSKNAVLRAAIRHHANEIADRIATDWQGIDTLSEKLDAFLSHSVIEPFRAVRHTPDFEDLASGFNAEGREEIEQANERLAALLATALSPHAIALGTISQTPERFAEFVQLSAHRLKYGARDEAHLRELLGALKAATLAVSGVK